MSHGDGIQSTSSTLWFLDLYLFRVCSTLSDTRGGTPFCLTSVTSLQSPAAKLAALALLIVLVNGLQSGLQRQNYIQGYTS